MLAIDRAGRRVFVNGQEIRLKPMEFDLLAYLASRPGVAVPSSEIIDAVWGVGCMVNPHMVATNVCRVRKRTGLRSAIKTIHRFGYRFDGA